jgi:hypothetical protein
MTIVRPATACMLSNVPLIKIWISVNGDFEWATILLFVGKSDADDIFVAFVARFCLHHLQCSLLESLLLVPALPTLI